MWGLALLAAGAGLGEEAFFRAFLQNGGALVAAQKAGLAAPLVTYSQKLSYGMSLCMVQLDRLITRWYVSQEQRSSRVVLKVRCAFRSCNA